MESTRVLFQQSPRCRLPFRILAVPHKGQRCSQHRQTIGDDLAEIGPRSIFIMYFRNVVVTTPVIGKSSGLVPAVDVSTIV